MRNKTQMQKTALKTKVKRMLIAGGLAALVAVPLLSGNAGIRKVDAAQGDVKINSTNFPDAEFRKYISKNIDKNKDGVLSKAEIKKVTEITLEDYDGDGNEYVYNDLTGIGVFTELKRLECESQKSLSKLDLHKNTKLEFIKCGYSGIKELNVSKLTKLKELRCYSSKLTKLDVSKNAKLSKIVCSRNKLTKLDVTKNLDLVDLYCDANKLAKLNVDKNEKLVCLDCSDNKLTQLHLTNNKQLVKLACAKNQLTQLDTSHNNALVWVECTNNKLTKLDLSASPLCQLIQCEVNKLTEIIVPKNIENDRIAYDKNLKVSIKKKTKPVKNGTYFVEDTYNYPYCTFRVTSTKAGNRTASVGVWTDGGYFTQDGWKSYMKGIKYGNQTYKLTSIDSGAFAGATFSEYDGNNNIVIGGSIKTIGSKAFAGTKVLKTITLGTSVEKIGSYASANSRDLKVLKIKITKLTSKTLSKKTFAGVTSKTTVKVPKSKLSAYKKLFRKCGLSKNVKVKAI